MAAGRSRQIGHSASSKSSRNSLAFRSRSWAASLLRASTVASRRACLSRAEHRASSICSRLTSIVALAICNSMSCAARRCRRGALACPSALACPTPTSPGEGIRALTSAAADGKSTDCRPTVDTPKGIHAGATVFRGDTLSA